MKKIVKRIFLVLLAMVTAYTVVATVLVHGVSVYRLNSRLGAALANSRQVTFLVAVVLWVVALILFWRGFSARRKNRKLSKSPAGAANLPGATKDRKNWKKILEKSAAEADKIPPKGVRAPLPNPLAEKGIAPKKGTMPMPAGEPVGSPTGPTMPMPVGSASGPTMPMPAGEPVVSSIGPTVPMPGQEKEPPFMDFEPRGEASSRSNADVTSEKAPDAAVRKPESKLPDAGSICPKCGSMVRAGAKFCTKCGCRLEVQV